MLFISIILGIAFVSILLAYMSLVREQKKQHIEETKKILAKGRVLYYASPSSSSS